MHQPRDLLQKWYWPFYLRACFFLYALAAMAAESNSTRLGVQTPAVLLAVLVLNSALLADAREAWQRPGCHLIGHTRTISIPDCVQFEVETNACRGYCESWAIPSSPNTLRINPHQTITSFGQCCNMMETEDVEVRVMCLGGPRDLVFKSAKSCSCYHCKKE